MANLSRSILNALVLVIITVGILSTSLIVAALIIVGLITNPIPTLILLAVFGILTIGWSLDRV